jgi:phenylacetate-CoA ligase
VVRTLAELNRTQWLPREEIEHLQQDRLAALLSHAVRKVPLYRTAMGKGALSPGGLKRADAVGLLRTLEVVTKERLRARRSEFVSEDAGQRVSFENSTGGSTGEPLRFVQDRLYEVHRRAAMYRGFGWCGWPLGGRVAYLWGHDPDHGARTWRGRLLDGLFGNTRIDAFSLEEAGLDGILDDLGSARPDLLVGYASSLQLLARRALERGGGPRLRAVQSSAEMLDAAARREIEQAFSCRVLDRYGCREAGTVAHECEAGEGWHINAESVVVETESDGSLLVTTLMNYSMPLIRYRNEDLVSLGEGACSCGRGLPLLTKVIGRRSDIIQSPSGRAIHGEFFTHLFYDAPGVRAFQVVQTSLTELVVRVVAEEGFDGEQRERIRRAIHERGDPGFKITWERVPRIPPGPSGKRRFTIRQIPDGEPGSLR